MYDLPTAQSIRAALGQPLAPSLHQLLSDRLSDMFHCGLQNYTHVLVFETGDSAQEAAKALGFDPLSKQTEYDWIDFHGGWWELLYCVAGTDFAYIILVEEGERSPFATQQAL